MKLAIAGEELPEDLKKQLSRQYFKGGNDYTLLLDKLTEIFEASEKESLSLDDIIVAYWKRHNSVLKRASLSAKLASLADEEKIVRQGRTLYKLP